METQEWSIEELASGEVHCHQIVRSIHRERTEYQTIEVVETKGYGLGLFLDGRIQHVEADEYVYSEVMVHPAMTLLGGRNRRALVVGGGPGGVVRELLRHSSIASVTQVEIDQKMIEVARGYFRHISQGCWHDPRVHLVIEDIRQYLTSDANRQFDLIVFDVSEPLAGTPAQGLFARDMLDNLCNRLSPAGLFVTWAGSAGPQSGKLATAIATAVRSAFRHTAPLLCHTQSYGTSWITLVAGQTRFEPVPST